MRKRTKLESGLGERLFMLIRVVYQNDKHDMVKPFILDSLISANRLKKFLRSDGWATIGTDRLRGMGGQFSGFERRKNTIHIKKPDYSLSL
jgi:hypothetical protein